MCYLVSPDVVETNQWNHVVGTYDGFTMSLFIGNLAFVESTHNMDGVKIGVLVGSSLSAIVGYFLLFFVSKKK